MKKCFKLVYEVGMMVLALASITILLVPVSYPWMEITDNIIVAVFMFDYIVRLLISRDKKDFFKHNVIDLISALPFNAMFKALRVFKILKVLKLAKFARLAAVFARFSKKISPFLKTNGFNYVLWCSVGLIGISSLLISYLEQKSLADALWWSVVTVTTVGYGDISPETAAGRIIAVILMIFGIGFLGMLTGTITTYFTRKTQRKTNRDELNDIIEKLSEVQVNKLIEYSNSLIEKDKMER